MNIIVNIDKNTIANKQPKLYDLGEVTTSVQNLLDNSTIVITNDRLVILRFTDLDLSVKQGFLILNDYSEGDKYGLGQNILESDLIYFSSGSSGNFIPLSGTTAGNPVTGDIEFNDLETKIYVLKDGNLFSLSPYYGGKGNIDLGVNMSLQNALKIINCGIDENKFSVKYINVNTGEFYSLEVPSDLGTVINSTNPNSFGIRSIIDHSSNITDLGYTQKIYVDGLRGKHISKTTTEINAIATPQAGETYFNTTLSTLCFYDGAAWKQVVNIAM